jgi:thiamine biosynthesis lipoprotein
VDLSGIAKGYGVDRLAGHLEGFDIHDYLIEIGGDLRVRGRNPRGERWTIGVEKPLPGLTAIQRVIRPRDAVVATSGNYRNYFNRKGRRYSHVIHPRTGEPIADDLASVTTIGRSTMTADAIATMLMVLGLKEGYRFAEQEQLAALFVLTDGQEFAEITTPAFDRHSISS